MISRCLACVCGALGSNRVVASLLRRLTESTRNRLLPRLRDYLLPQLLALFLEISISLSLYRLLCLLKPRLLLGSNLGRVGALREIRLSLRFGGSSSSLLLLGRFLGRRLLQLLFVSEIRLLSRLRGIGADLSEV